MAQDLPNPSEGSVDKAGTGKPQSPIILGADGQPLPPSTAATTPPATASTAPIEADTIPVGFRLVKRPDYNREARILGKAVQIPEYKHHMWRYLYAAERADKVPPTGPESDDAAKKPNQDLAVVPEKQLKTYKNLADVDAIIGTALIRLGNKKTAEEAERDAPPLKSELIVLPQQLGADMPPPPPTSSTVPPAASSSAPAQNAAAVPAKEPIIIPPDDELPRESSRGGHSGNQNQSGSHNIQFGHGSYGNTINIGRDPKLDEMYRQMQETLQRLGETNPQHSLTPTDGNNGAGAFSAARNPDWSPGLSWSEQNSRPIGISHWMTIASAAVSVFNPAFIPAMYLFGGTSAFSVVKGYDDYKDSKNKLFMQHMADKGYTVTTKTGGLFGFGAKHSTIGPSSTQDSTAGSAPIPPPQRATVNPAAPIMH